MGRLGGLSDALATLLGELGLHPSHQVMLLLLALLLAVSFPWIRRNMRTGAARNLVLRIGAADPAERTRLKDEALQLVSGNPMGLVAVADEALRRQHSDLARRAIEALRRTGRERAHQLRLQQALDGPGDGTPEEAILAIERLLEVGLVDAARIRWHKARARFPQSAALAELEVALRGPGD